MEPSRTEILVGVHDKVQENQQETFHHLQQKVATEQILPVRLHRLAYLQHAVRVRHLCLQLTTDILYAVERRRFGWGTIAKCQPIQVRRSKFQAALKENIDCASSSSSSFATIQSNFRP